jgi:uncharacterized membrane protein
MNPGCSSLFFSLIYALFMLQFQQDALTRLGLSPGGAGLFVLATLVGGFIDLPIYYRVLPSIQDSRGRGLFGLSPLWRDPWGRPQVQWVAVNFGGFVVPVALSLMALIRLEQLGVAFGTVLMIGLLVTGLAYRCAQVVAGQGVLMRPLWPALFAAFLAGWLCPGAAPLVAYPCGVLGVLVGADLLNLGKVLGQGTPFVSIGGAGTFDGIVMTGILASLLAG